MPLLDFVSGVSALSLVLTLVAIAGTPWSIIESGPMTFTYTLTTVNTNTGSSDDDMALEDVTDWDAVEDDNLKDTPTVASSVLAFAVISMIVLFIGAVYTATAERTDFNKVRRLTIEKALAVLYVLLGFITILLAGMWTRMGDAEAFESADSVDTCAVGCAMSFVAGIFLLFSGVGWLWLAMKAPAAAA